MSYRPVVSSFAKNGLDAIRKRLILKGTERLSNLPAGVLKPEKCPLCQTKLTHPALKNTEMGHVQLIYNACPNCGYQQRTFTISDQIIELSMLVELAIASLAYEMRYRV